MFSSCLHCRAQFLYLFCCIHLATLMFSSYLHCQAHLRCQSREKQGMPLCTGSPPAIGFWSRLYLLMMIILIVNMLMPLVMIFSLMTMVRNPLFVLFFCSFFVVAAFWYLPRWYSPRRQLCAMVCLFVCFFSCISLFVCFLLHFNQSVTNIFEYSNIRLYQSGILIRTFARFDNFDTNIFGHSLMSNLFIYSDIHSWVY